MQCCQLTILSIGSDFYGSTFSNTANRHIRLCHYVLTPPIPFGQIVHCEAKPFPLCQCCLQRVALADAKGAADFLRNDHTPEVVPLCQVGAKKFCELSGKPFISMVLGYPDGATMHLRGFDRLCYFRSKFDSFALK